MSTENTTIKSYNSLLQNSFLGAAIVGAAIMFTNIPIQIALRSEDIRPFLDANNLTETVRYFSNHVRNGGQAIFYGQIANYALGTILKERSELKHLKETRVHQDEALKDKSILVGSALTVGNIAYEFMFGANSYSIQHSLSAKQLDTHDMLWVGIGAASLALWNKTTEMIARHKFPDVQTGNGSKPIQQTSPDPTGPQ